MNNQITVETTISAPIEKIWEYWTEPEHITRWCFASPDWCAPHAVNNVEVGSTFTTRMESKDGTQGFDFSATYTEVEKYKKLAYVMDDGRKVDILFVEEEEGVYKVVETFDPETLNPIEIQRAGWQAILDNFKKYVDQNV